MARRLYNCCISFYSYIKPQHCRPSSGRRSRCISFYSYIKPQLYAVMIPSKLSCISFYSYIKPQLAGYRPLLSDVVYRSIPTSNRNHGDVIRIHEFVVYRSIPTSNRNMEQNTALEATVVYRSIPTSNRNCQFSYYTVLQLYIVLFLHQTATLFSKLPLNKEIQGYWRDKKTEV